MNIADFCLKHKVTTIMAYVLIVVFGIMGFTSLPLVHGHGHLCRRHRYGRGHGRPA